ncbi:TonB-dependent receptor [Novosphingobium sp.]|uniref:TonB-dependent receptor n=1 Tax=Novosphingobium sp. TaxID=1874826 RepID=UPI0025F201FD|nr:TonB-dependent receptor [Novosphingobium sp.]MCC6926540.1 TonB-dependent receptor [Novosphingobium sp.]
MPKAYRFGATAVSALAMAMLAPQAAFAQEAPADEGASDGQEITVSGIRYSLGNAINEKRKNESIVEAVSAEDIGKLPDVSIAESIARLPGLAAQRVNGRAQVISLRGFSPDFTTTFLNGRPQASSGDNRSVEFDQYPSELLNMVVVYKTPDASISGMGLSGSIDLRTVRPLEYGKRAFVVNMRGEVNSGGKLNDDVRNWGWRASASWIGQNADGTVGWALGYAHLDSPSQNRHVKAYGYEKFDHGCFWGDGPSWCDPALNGRVAPASARNSQFISGQEVFAYSREQRRDAAIGILELQPSEKAHLELDLYYSSFKQREVMRGVQWFDNPWADQQTLRNVSNATVGGTDVAVSGMANGIAPQLRNDYNTRDDQLFSAGLNGEFAMTDKLKLVADLSYSTNTRDESITETYAGFGCCATSATQNANRVFDSIGFDFTQFLAGQGFPDWSEGLNYSDASRVSLGDRAPWGGWGHDGQTKEPHVKETVFATDIGFNYEMDGPIKSVDFGANYSRTTKSKDVAEFDLFLKNGRTQALVDPQYLVNPTSLGFAGMGSVLSVNLPLALPVYYDKTVYVDRNTFDKAWDIAENTITLKAKMNIDTGNLHGNIGVQWVHQEQKSHGYAINFLVTPRQVDPISDGTSYSDWLPSLNLTYELGGGHRVRLGLSRQMARPRMDEMRADFIPGADNICGGGGGSSAQCQPGGTIHPWNANGGNAKLEPWRAKSIDVAYEWYIDKSSYIAISGFYKDLENYVYLQQQSFDFSGLTLPPSVVVPVGVTVSPIGTIRQPANGKGGSIYGVEVSGALNFGKIAPVLDGFGVIASYSYVKSNLRPTDSTNPNTVQATRIPGLSNHVYNITGYFEKGGFQARASYRYRSGFKGEVVQLFANRGLTEILADRQLDAQIGYTFPDGSSLGGLSILLQANNVTDSPYRTRLGVDGGGPRTNDGGYLPEIYEKYGRQFLLGFSYKF